MLPGLCGRTRMMVICAACRPVLMVCISCCVSRYPCFLIVAWIAPTLARPMTLQLMVTTLTLRPSFITMVHSQRSIQLRDMEYVYMPSFAPDGKPQRLTATPYTLQGDG